MNFVSGRMKTDIENQTVKQLFYLFYSKITFWPISQMAKTFAAKMLVSKMSTAKMLQGKYLEPIKTLCIP